MRNSVTHFTFAEQKKTPFAAGTDEVVSADMAEEFRDTLSFLLSRYSTRLFKLENNYIVTGSHCGVYAYNGFSIQVIPKLVAGLLNQNSNALANLSHMIERTGLDSEIPLTSESLSKHDGSLLESLAFHYAHSLHHALKLTPLLQYSECSETLLHKRGRVSVADTMRNSAKGFVNLHCVFDTFDQNNLVNRVFFYLCSRLIRFCSREKTQRLLRDCQRGLFQDKRNSSITEEISSIQIGRQWSIYERPWRIAQMILRKQSLDFSGRGEVPVSLEFDMNKVFEAYVATLIKEMQLDIQGCKISCQREISLSDSRFGLRSSDDGDVVNGIIDLDIESEGSISFVIDTKYKILEAGENPLTSDIFQVLTYAEFRSRQTNKKFVPLLLYPKTSSSEPIAYVSKVAGWSWVTGFVDFDDSLKKSEEKAKLSIQEAIKMASLLHQREHRLGI